MAAYHRVYDLRHLQADCQEPGSAPEPYAQYSSMGYLYFFYCGLQKLFDFASWKQYKCTAKEDRLSTTIIQSFLTFISHCRWAVNLFDVSVRTLAY